MTLEKRPLTLTVNGQAVGPVDVPAGMPMIHFLHEYLGLTGTHFGCGQAICHACVVMEKRPNGTLAETRTCIFDAHYFQGKSIITIEGHANRNSQGDLESLSPIQQAFIEHFAFQCGYCTSGFVAGATVFIENLKQTPVQREQLQEAIETALEPHICRCTGYVRYYEAVRQVALATPGCVTD